MRGQIVREDPNPVAAHLRDRSVTVAIVHEPVFIGDARRYLREDAGIAQPVRGCDAEQSVGTDTAVPITECRDEVRRQVELNAGIGQQHEVVLGAVSLHEIDMRPTWSTSNALRLEHSAHDTRPTGCFRRYRPAASSACPSTS